MQCLYIFVLPLWWKQNVMRLRGNRSEWNNERFMRVWAHFWLSILRSNTCMLVIRSTVQQKCLLVCYSVRLVLCKCSTIQCGVHVLQIMVIVHICVLCKAECQYVVVELGLSCLPTNTHVQVCIYTSDLFLDTVQWFTYILKLYINESLVELFSCIYQSQYRHISYLCLVIVTITKFVYVSGLYKVLQPL